MGLRYLFLVGTYESAEISCSGDPYKSIEVFCPPPPGHTATERLSYLTVPLLSGSSSRLSGLTTGPYWFCPARICWMVSRSRRIISAVVNARAGLFLFLSTAMNSPVSVRRSNSCFNWQNVASPIERLRASRSKPITLFTGSELLYLLQKHGHKARIDLAEARMLTSDKEKRGFGGQ